VPSRKNVQTTHMSPRLRTLHEALMDIVSVINRPQRDARMVQEAGISLDRALFPLLVIVERRGPIGVVDLADRVGRDHTTVSRQVAKLESLGLVAREEGATDRRVRQVAVTAKGKAMTDQVDEARERLGQAIFATWDESDVEALTRLLRKFADALRPDLPDGPPSGPAET
jgi:DNA-binding MarR family transcriptional regulator